MYKPSSNEGYQRFRHCSAPKQHCLMNERSSQCILSSFTGKRKTKKNNKLEKRKITQSYDKAASEEIRKRNNTKKNKYLKPNSLMRSSRNPMSKENIHFGRNNISNKFRGREDGKRLNLRSLDEDRAKWAVKSSKEKHCENQKRTKCSSDSKNRLLLTGYSSNCEAMDKDALKNMRDNIESFVMEKANYLRNAESKTASVFEGEGENDYIEESGLERRRPSQIWSSKKVFLEPLFDHAKHLKEGKSIKSLRMQSAEDDSISMIKNGKCTLTNEDSTFECSGDMSDIIFSFMRISKEKLNIKKKGKKFHRNNIAKTSKPAATNELRDRPGVNELKKCVDEVLQEKNDKDNFLKCDVFESVGENIEIDCNNMRFACMKHKSQNRNENHKRKTGNDLNHCERRNKHYSKFTLCRHNYSLGQQGKYDMNFQSDNNGTTQIDNSHQKARSDTGRQKSIVHEPPAEGSVLLDKRLDNRLAKETSGKESYSYSSFKKTIGKPLLPEAYNFQIHTDPKNSQNKTVQETHLQFCIPARKPSLFNSESSSTKQSSQRKRPANLLLKTKDESAKKNTLSSRYLPLTKSLDSFYSRELLNLRQYLFNDRQKSSRKVFSDSRLNEHYKTYCGHRYSAIESSVDNSSKKLPSLKKPSQNMKNSDIDREDVYECEGGSSGYLEVKRYVKLRNALIQGIFDIPGELVDQYTLDTSGLNKQESLETLTMRRETFNALHSVPIRFRTNKDWRPVEARVAKHDRCSMSAKDVPQREENLQADKMHVLVVNNGMPEKISQQSRTGDKIDQPKSQNKRVRKAPHINERNTEVHNQVNKNNIHKSNNKNQCTENRDKQITKENLMLRYNPLHPLFEKNHEKFENNFVQNGLHTINEDIKNIKIKFENNFSSAYLQKKESDEGRQPCKAIRKALRTGRKKVMSLFYSVA